MTETSRAAGRRWIAAGVVALAVGAWLWSATSVGLGVQHALQLWLLRHVAATTIEVDGVEPLPMFLEPTDRVVTPRMIGERVWEPKETYWFVESLREGDTVVDVGANVGYYTLIAASLVGPEGRVYAFEPDPRSFSLLERNVRLNGFSNVVLERKAVADQAGTLRLYLAPENKGDHRIYAPSDEQRDWIEVEAITLDDYFGERAAEVDLVKIDTQGAELSILRGMSRILESSERLVLAMEYWPHGLRDFGEEPGELLDLLTAQDFRFFDLAGFLVRPLEEVGQAELLARFPPGNRWFTDLFLVKGRAEMEGLRAELERWEAATHDDSDPERRLEAERELARIRTELAALAPAAPGFPRQAQTKASQP